MFKYTVLVSKYARPKTPGQKTGAGVVLLLLVLASAIFLVWNNTKSRPTAEALEEPAPVPAPLPTEVNPNFMTQVNACFLPTAAAYGFNLRITSDFRTLDEQDTLYEQGRTKDGHIVTDAPGGRSIHNFGYAIDVVDRFDGYDIDWEKLGKIASYCGLEQGDDGDLAHFDHRENLSTQEFLEGKRPSVLSLPCAVMAQRLATGTALTIADLNSCGAPNFN